jgi:hypothetical protein
MRLLACIGFVQASPNRRGECQMLQFGNASWSFFSPASVTSVRTRLSVWSWVNPLRSARAVASCHPWRIEAAASLSRYNRGRASFPEATPMTDVTRILSAIEQGDPSGAEQLRQ